jgi:hypothetical protein
MSDIDWDDVRAQLGVDWLDDLDTDRQAEGQALIEDLVSDWTREAATSSDPAGVLRFLRQDLEDLRGGPSDADPLTPLRIAVARRRADRLSVATFGLGKAVLAGSIDDAEAKRQGRALLDQVEQLAAEVRRLPDERTAALRRELGDSSLEARYAMERGALSLRLERERQAARPTGGPNGDGPGAGPPDIR